MNYGIKITLNKDKVKDVILYDLNKNIQFIMLSDSFYPLKIDSNVVDFFKISREQFFDILGDFKFNPNYKNFSIFCKRYSLEELLI